MKQIILFSFLLTLSLGLQAQVSFAPESPEVFGKATSTDIKIDLDVINDLAEEQVTFWYIDRLTPTEHDHLVPTEWEFQLCDKNTCYVWGLEACPEGNPAVFNANETFTYNLHMNPHNVAGVGDVLLNITAEDGSILTSIPVHYDVEETSSTLDIDIKQIKIYPNPTTDFIQIANDNNVAKVAIYNIVGKNLKTSAHYTGKSHDVSSLQKGIYLVRLFDENDKVLSVLRLNKSGGA